MSLQWILTHSFYAKLLAVKRVTANKGKNTPGMDGVIWKTSSQKIKGALSLTRKGYKASPLRRVYIPKANGKKRPLGIPTIKDRAMQALFYMALIPIAETNADLNSYGFRPKRSCADAIGQCFIVFGQKKAAQWVLEADIKGCFDHISHQWLLEHIPMDKQVLRKWLKAGIIEHDQFSRSIAGTPQGGIISPVLANLALDGLEGQIDQACGIKRHDTGQKCNKGTHPKINFVRYADDFVVSAEQKSSLEEGVLPTVVTFLKERGLTIQAEKTKITHIEQGFDFLGQTVRKFDGVLLIKPSKKSIKTIKRKAFEIIKNSHSLRADQLIQQLNPVLRGWANYHRHVVSSRAFSGIDNAIYLALWRWARRRHSKKSQRWIARKYFIPLGNRNGVFATKNGDKTVILFRMENIKIERFIKVRNRANPFDEEWASYFECRKFSRVRKANKN